MEIKEVLLLWQMTDIGCIRWVFRTGDQLVWAVFSAIIFHL